MRRGRPGKGLSHVDDLAGDPALKERLKAILLTLTGELTVGEAAKAIGISKSRFHELRKEALSGMLEGISPRPPGRPPKEPVAPETEEANSRISWLEEELQIARLRTEIALARPDLLRPPETALKKRGSSPTGSPRRRSTDARRDTSGG